MWATGRDVPEEPRVAVAAFETWCLERLTAIWSAGKDPEGEIDDGLAAFLVQRYLADAGRGLAFRYRLSAEEWEDLVSQAAERAIVAFRRKPVDEPKAYLWTTIKRGVWEHVRKAGREIPTEFPTDPPDPAPDPEVRALWGDALARFLDVCWAALKARDQRLLEGMVVGGRSAADLGAEVGMLASAVNVRVFRARARLRDCLRQQLKLEDPFA